MEGRTGDTPTASGDRGGRQRDIIGQLVFCMLFCIFEYMPINKEQFIKKIEALENLQEHIDNCQKIIDSEIEKQNQYKVMYDGVVRTNSLPAITISEIAKSENVDAHLRASASYEFGNKRIRFNIYIGKQSEYPLGKNDPKAIQTVREKAFEYLRKKHPTLFIDM